MPTLRRILFATDFSEASHNAQAMAVQLAQRHDAELHIVHVEVAPPMAYVPELVVDLDALTRNLHDAASTQMTQLQDRIGLPVHTALIAGVDAATAITDHAEAQDVDLIVVGSHGRAGLKKFFLGSDAQGVVRQSTRAVLLVGPQSGDHPHPKGFQRILAPVDLSPASAASLADAAALARHDHAGLAVLHVVEAWPVPPYYVDRFEQAQVAHGTAALEAFLRDHPTQPEPECEVFGGTPDTRIVERAKAQGSDLIVLARGGLGDWEHVLLGSVTERVMAHAPCPVWIAAVDQRAQ